MAQHGYLHDSYDRSDFGHGDDREPSWRDSDDERFRSRGRDYGRGMMFRDSGRAPSGWGSDEYRSSRDQDDHRGFFSRMKEEARDWFDDDDDRRFAQSGERSLGSDSSEWFGGRQDRGREQFSSHPDDHYRSWRDRQIAALDRDYQDYCREREQQFHQDFDSWRRNRQSGSTGQASGQQETATSPASSELLLDRDSEQPTATGSGRTESGETGSSTTTRGRR